MGHTLDLPFTPLTTAPRHALMPPGSPPVYMGGGNRPASAGDQARAWAAVGDFLGTTLGL